MTHIEKLDAEILHGFKSTRMEFVGQLVVRTIHVHKVGSVQEDVAGVIRF